MGHHLGRQLDSPRATSSTSFSNLFSQSSICTPPRGLTNAELHAAWDLDYLGFSPDELMQLAASVFHASGVVDAFKIKDGTMSSFLKTCCSRYHENPYHNFNHCVHVAHGAYLHACAGIDHDGSRLDPLELLALLMSAICHDIEHPGVTNAFLVKTGSPLAIEYNDISVLESMHSATAFHILSLPECDILSALSVEQRQAVRSLIIGNVLSTDMAHHNTMVRELAEMAASRKPVPASYACKAFCHLADIGNVAMSWERSEQWSARVGQEAVNEAIETKRLGLLLAPQQKLEPYSRAELAKRTLVFTDLFVYPLYSAAAILFPGAKGRLSQIHANREECKRVIARTRFKSAASRIRVSLQLEAAAADAAVGAAAVHKVVGHAQGPAAATEAKARRETAGSRGKWVV